MPGSRIQLFAFVCEEGLPFPEFSRIYLKLYALSVFVHEVAHHQDQMIRTARGRWRADQPDNSEIYAENWEYQWTHEAVIPYLKEAYEAEVEALAHWVKEQIGINIPLTQLAGDPRRTAKGGWRIFFPFIMHLNRCLHHC